MWLNLQGRKSREDMCLSFQEQGSTHLSDFFTSTHISKQSSKAVCLLCGAPPDLFRGELTCRLLGSDCKVLTHLLSYFEWTSSLIQIAAEQTARFSLIQGFWTTFQLGRCILQERVTFKTLSHKMERQQSGRMRGGMEITVWV